MQPKSYAKPRLYEWHAGARNLFYAPRACVMYCISRRRINFYYYFVQIFLCDCSLWSCVSLFYRGKCVLPSYPKNGNYSMLEKPTAHPGLVVDSALLIFSCSTGYKLYGTSQYVNCLKGSWPYDPPKCLCK